MDTNTETAVEPMKKTPLMGELVSDFDYEKRIAEMTWYCHAEGHDYHCDCYYDNPSNPCCYCQKGK
jgi:hypothetical protein